MKPKECAIAGDVRIVVPCRAMKKVNKDALENAMTSGFVHGKGLNELQQAWLEKAIEVVVEVSTDYLMWNATDKKGRGPPDGPRYIPLFGPPGSGKTTTLAVFLHALQIDTSLIVRHSAHYIKTGHSLVGGTLNCSVACRAKGCGHVDTSGREATICGEKVGSDPQSKLRCHGEVTEDNSACLKCMKPFPTLRFRCGECGKNSKYVREQSFLDNLGDAPMLKPNSLVIADEVSLIDKAVGSQYESRLPFGVVVLAGDGHQLSCVGEQWMPPIGPAGARADPRDVPDSLEQNMRMHASAASASLEALLTEMRATRRGVAPAVDRLESGCCYTKDPEFGAPEVPEWRPVTAPALRRRLRPHIRQFYLPKFIQKIAAKHLKHPERAMPVLTCSHRLRRLVNEFVSVCWAGKFIGPDARLTKAGIPVLLEKYRKAGPRRGLKLVIVAVHRLALVGSEYFPDKGVQYMVAGCRAVQDFGEPFGRGWVMKLRRLNPSEGGYCEKTERRVMLEDNWRRPDAQPDWGGDRENGWLPETPFARVAAYEGAYASAMEAYCAEGRLRAVHAAWVHEKPYLRQHMDEDTGLIDIAQGTVLAQQQRRRVVDDVWANSRDDPLLQALWLAPMSGVDFDAAFALCIGAMTQGGEYDNTVFLMSATGDWRPGAERPNSDGYRRQTVGLSRHRETCTVVEMLTPRGQSEPGNFWKRRRRW